MNRSTLYLPTLLLVLFVVSPALHADILYLEGGGRVEGVVTDEGKSVRVQGLHGSVLVRKSKILDRQVTPYVTEIYEEKLGAMDEGDADAHHRLAVWCRKNGLKKRMAAHLLRVRAEIQRRFGD